MSDKRVLYFTSPFCGPCKRFIPTIQELSECITIQKVDASTNLELSKKFNITSVPTLIEVENGVEVTRITGVKTLDELKSHFGI